MNDLTPIQSKVLDLLRRRADCGEPPPTYRDLCREFGWSSTGTARDHLRALARKGFIDLAGGRARLTRLNAFAPAVRVPLLGHVAVGIRSPAEEYLPVPAHWVRGASAFALRAHGDSMIGAGILDGDVVVVSKQSAAEDGDIVAATVDGVTTLKRLRWWNGRHFLAAENPAFPDIELRDREPVVRGVVVGLLRLLSGSHGAMAREEHNADASLRLGGVE